MKPLAYVIMPVGSDPDHMIRRSRIDAAAHALHIATLYPLDHRHHDEEFDAATIRDEVRRAAVAIVDLSLERPSCYYELGVLQGVGVPTLLVAKRGTPIHQTAHRGSVIFYDSFDELEERLRRRLRKYSPLALAR